MVYNLGKKRTLCVSSSLSMKRRQALARAWQKERVVPIVLHRWVFRGKDFFATEIEFNSAMIDEVGEEDVFVLVNADAPRSTQLIRLRSFPVCRRYDVRLSFRMKTLTTSDRPHCVSKISISSARSAVIVDHGTGSVADGAEFEYFPRSFSLVLIRVD